MKNSEKVVLMNIVRYFIITSKISASPRRVYDAVILEKEIRVGTYYSITSSVVFMILCCVFVQNRFSPDNVVDTICAFWFASGFSTVIIMLKTYLKIIDLDRFCHSRPEALNLKAFFEFKEANRNFQEVFGARPERLGIDGVAKFLTRLTTEKLALERKDCVTPQSRGVIITLKEVYRLKEPERRLKARFEYAYEYAEVLMPVHRKEEIFETAELGLKKPFRLLSFDD